MHSFLPFHIFSLEAASGAALGAHFGIISLPWETSDETKSILSEPLMEKILLLSVVEVSMEDGNW